MLIVTQEQIMQHVTIGPIIEAVEAAFRSLGRGESSVFPVSRGTGTDPSHVIAIKSARDGASGLIGVKAASYNPANRQMGLTAHSSTTMLIDDVTAEVIAVVEANYLNGMRTAAADAVAVRHLARADAHVLGVLGTGAQAAFEVEAIREVRPIDTVVAGSRSRESDGRFADAVHQRTGLEVCFASAREVVGMADIIVTASPAMAPILEPSWVRPGTHISAMGSDNVGKQELPVELTAKSLFYMDHPPQALILGEGQHLVSSGLCNEEELFGRSLGSLLCGTIAGRSNPDEITIFDSTGVAIQDIAAASVALAMVFTGRNYDKHLD